MKKPTRYDEFRAAAEELTKRGDVPAEAVELMQAMLTDLREQSRLTEINARLSAAHKRQAEQYRREARFDAALTGLPNRLGFMDAFTRHVADSARHPDRTHVLMICDVDGFKPVNDTYGHKVGDQLLRHIGDILRPPAPGEEANKHHLFRATDTVARLGGDEFVMLLPEVRRGQAGHMVSLLQERIEKEKPFSFTDEKTGATITLPVRMSMGFVTLTGPENDKVFQRFSNNAGKSDAPTVDAKAYFDFLYARADARLYKNKALRKGLRQPEGKQPNPKKVADQARKRQDRKLNKLANKL